MNIVELTAENVKRIKALSIRPDRKPVILTGANGQGKSTALDCILIALGKLVPEVPIRAGENKAQVRLDLGELIVERRFTQKGSYLVVTDRNGAKMASPQALLDKLYGMGIDPMAFTRMKPKEQREMLLKVAGVDLAAWETEHKAAYDARTLANRDAAQAKVRYEGMADPEGAAELPESEVSVSDLMASYDAVKERRKAAEDHAKNVEAAKADIEAAKQKVSNLERQLAEARDELDATMERSTQIISVKVDNPTDEQIAEAKARCDNADGINRKIRQRQEKAKARKAWEDAQKVADQSEEAVTKIRRKKDAMLEKADFGVPGLSVDDDGVTVGGIPFGQLSTAQQVEVSTVMAMAQNPKLKIIMIREGALIGREIWDKIVKLAADREYDLFIEKFQEDAGEVGLHIEDGQVVAIDGKPVESLVESDDAELDIDSEEVDF